MAENNTRKDQIIDYDELDELPDVVLGEQTLAMRKLRENGKPVVDTQPKQQSKQNKALDEVNVYDQTTGIPSVEELLKQSDYISLHCPLTPQTRHMINKETIAMMKPTAYIINTGRGALIDEPALIEALKEGRIAGAGLDVQETEPPVQDNPLYDMPNVILTPHMGWKGLETRQRLVSILAANIQAFDEGRPQNVVS